MDFTYDEEQQALREAVRGLVRKAYSDFEERRKAVLMSLSAVLGGLPLLLLFLVGGGQVIAGRLDIGAVYVFLNLSGNVSGVLGNLPGRIGGFRRFAANLARLQPNINLQGGR